MKKTMDKLMRLNVENDPTERLCAHVMLRIEQRENARMRRQTFLFGFLSLGALIALIPVVGYVSSAFASSGFGDFISLLGTDGSYVASNWQTALMSLAQSVPWLSITSLVAALLFSFVCVYYFARYLRSLTINERELVLS